MEPITSVLLILCVIALAVTQIPTDIRYKQLSRRSTLTGLFAVCGVMVADSFVSQSLGNLTIAILGCSVVLAIYVSLNRLAPHALGFGDVLLVVPLSLALSYTSMSSLAYWQMLAAISGSIHATIVRLRCGDRTIPFGPHLLLAAIAVLIVSV